MVHYPAIVLHSVDGVLDLYQDIHVVAENNTALGPQDPIHFQQDVFHFASVTVDQIIIHADTSKRPCAVDGRKSKLYTNLLYLSL